MRVLPAIDLMDGKVVRLTQGDFSQKADYALFPLETALQWKQAGFSMIHVISLDGVRDGKALYQDDLRSMVREGLDVEFGGGIRSLEQIETYLGLGMSRIIIGTSAFESGTFWQDAAARFGKDHLVLALDLKDGLVATRGWTATSGLTFDAALDYLGRDHILNVLVTDIRKDGSLAGVDASLYRGLRATYPDLNIIPAGGVTTLDDLAVLDEMGIHEVIVGKILYERPEFIQEIRSACYL
jgi:phosphoribosylformimino-5-aminoimidazole carboxamide ribotide isomerase